MSTEKLLPSRSPTSLRSRLDAMPLQNVSDCGVGESVAQIGELTLNPPITQARFSPGIWTTRSEISVAVGGRPGVLYALPSYFLAINFRCHADNVSGVTIVATCARSFRLSFFALAARRQRWSLVNRMRRLPICSRRTRFSSMRYSMTRC